MKRLCLSFIVIEFIFSYCLADTIIQMEEYNGVYKIPCTVNGAKMKFIFDTGASDVSLSQVEATFMMKNGFMTMVILQIMILLVKDKLRLQMEELLII